MTIHTTTQRRGRAARRRTAGAVRLGVVAAVVFGAVATLSMASVTPASAANPGSLSGTISSRPSCYAEAQAVTCVAKGSGNNLFARTRTGGAWAAWTQITTMQSAGAPDCVAKGGGEASCFFRTTGNNLGELAYWSGSWHDNNQGGTIASDPDCLVRHPGGVLAMDCAAFVSNGNLYEITYVVSSGWRAWKQVSSSANVVGRPSCTSSNDTTRVDCMVMNTSGELWQSTSTDGATTWTANTKIATGYSAVDVSCVVRQIGSTYYECFGRSSGGNLQQTWWNGSGWTTGNLGGGLAATAPECVSHGTGDIACFVRGSDNSVYSITLPSGGGWSAFTSSGWASNAPVGCTGGISTDYTCAGWGTDNAMWAWRTPDVAPTGANATTGNATKGTALAIALTNADGNGDSRTCAIVTQPTKGSVSLSGAAPSTGCSASYTASADTSGTATFTYKVTDGSGLDSPTYTITIPIANRAPTGSAVAAPGQTAGRGLATTINLANSDLDGDTARTCTTTAPTIGTLSTGTSCSRTLTLAANTSGTGSFSYTVSDGSGGTSGSYAVNYTIGNTAPAANGSTRSIPRGTSSVFNLSGSDVNGDTIDGSLATTGYATVSTTGMPAGATTNCTAAGACTVAIAAGTTPGNYSFTWNVKDNAATSTTATETVTVTNTAPVANAVTKNNVQRGRPGAEAAFSLNATDAVNGNALTYSVVSTTSMPLLSTVACSAVGACTVAIPADTTPGDYSFTYKANDGAADSNTATVTVGVLNTAPVANNVGVLETTVGQAVAATLNGTDVNGDTLSYQAPVAGPAKGSVSGTGPARSYTPTVGTKGLDTFTYRVLDNAATSSSDGTVSIMILNTAPTAEAKAVTAFGPQELSFQLAGGDVNADGLTYMVSQNATKGALACSAAGACTYTAGAGQSGTDSFKFVSNDGTANSAEATVTITIKPAPTITGDRTPAANVNGWNNEPVTASFTCGSDALESCTAPVVLSTDGANQSVTGSAVDSDGQTTSATVSGISIDQVDPALSGVASTPPNAAGWYREPVEMAWSCEDALSGISAGVCPAPSSTVGEGTAVSVPGSVHDRAGNQASGTSESVQIDLTAPSTGVSSPPTWSHEDVTLTLSASDAMSGVESTSYRVDGGPAENGTHPVVSGQGHHVVSFWSTDGAGNEESPSSVGVNIDTTAPSITAHVSPAANGAGWHRGDVDVTFTCGDADSGVATCTGDASFDHEVDTVVTGNASDSAGNTASEQATVRIDTSDPTVAAQVPSANGYGWFNGAVQVPFSCLDTGGSGVATCPAPMMLAGEGADQPVNGTAVDNAGNTGAAAGATVSVDLTAPTITGAAMNGSNGNGGFYGTVTIHWTCADALSGVVACPADQTVSGEGAHTVSASVNDRAGNTSSAEVTLRIDHDPANDPGIIHGRITDAVSGQPVKNAQVLLLAATPQLTTMYSTKTGTDGTYTFPVVADGRYKLAVSNWGVHLQAWYPNKANDVGATVLTIAHGANVTADQPLTPGYVLSGTLSSGTTGQPVSGATVRVQGGGVDYTATSDATGHYAVTGMVAGNRTVTFLGYGYDPLPVTLAVPAGGSTMNRTLAPAATSPGIQGTITALTSGGAPLAGATVRIWMKNGFTIAATATTGANGRYSFPSMPVGQYEVDVVRGDYQVRWFGDTLSRTGAVTVALTTSCTTTPDVTWGNPCATPVNIRMIKP